MPPNRACNTVTLATSIGAGPGTVQALDALRRSDGVAVTIDNDELVRWVARLVKAEGIWAEPSSVAPLAAIERLLAQGTIDADARVVALVTANGLKDTAAIETALPTAPIVSGGLGDLLHVLRQTYGFDHG